MLRTPKARLAAIRYLKNRIPVSSHVGDRINDDDSSSEESDTQDEENNQFQPLMSSMRAKEQEIKQQDYLYLSDYTMKIVNE